MRELPHTHSCFVCGESNAIGLRLRFETDGRIVQARFVPRAEHIGFKQVIHGGLLATVLDEIMVWACVVQTRRFAFCAEMNVRFLKPLRPDEPAKVTGELVTNRRDRIFEAKSELQDLSGTTLATGTGKYLPLRDSEAADMASDFVQGMDTWLLR